MKKLLLIVTLIVSLFALNSCATLTSSRSLNRMTRDFVYGF